MDFVCIRIRKTTNTFPYQSSWHPDIDCCLPFFHQGNTTIRSVWGRLHTGSSPAIRTTKQPRDQRPVAVVFCLIEKECEVKSAVTVVGSDVYFSLDRWEEEYGFYQLRHFKNDTIPGTYRISLKDFSMKKISDEIYDGLYNFDDTCLYVCYKQNIYQIDFDGNVQKVLLKVK